MVLGCNAALQLIERDGLPAFFYNLTHHGHLDAEELVALAVLALAGLKETAQVFGLCGVLAVKDFLVEGGGVTRKWIIFFAHTNRI